MTKLFSKVISVGSNRNSAIQYQVLCACCIGLIASCVQTTPHYDQKFGEATRTTLNMQVVDPNPDTTSLVSGVDGKAAGFAAKNYQKSFETLEKSENAFTVGVGK